MAKPINHERNKVIYRLRQEGKSYRQIATILSIDVATAYNGFKREVENRIEVKGKESVDLSTGKGVDLLFSYGIVKE
jgi:transposase